MVGAVAFEFDVPLASGVPHMKNQAHVRIDRFEFVHGPLIATDLVKSNWTTEWCAPAAVPRSMNIAVAVETTLSVFICAPFSHFFGACCDRLFFSSSSRRLCYPSSAHG
jgi:hypothetical protein